MWDVVILVAILYVALIVPFNAAFNTSGYSWAIIIGRFEIFSFAQDDCAL